MTIIDNDNTRIDVAPDTAGPDFQLAAVDLYRDIHKGIRCELFAITSAAGSLDSDDYGDRVALATHIDQMAGVLESHAHHEDRFIDPILRQHLPAFAAQIEAEHEQLERRYAWLTEIAHDLVDAPGPDRRRIAHLLYLEMSGFTSRYLRHQLVEEGQVMPELAWILGPAGCGELHGAIVGSIPPDELARSLAFMLPAMSPHDRAEMVGGIRMAAPPPAFAAVLGLARSVLEPRQYDRLIADLSPAADDLEFHP